MQKLVNGVWTDCLESDLVVGEQYRISVGGGWEQKSYSAPVAALPVVPITLVVIGNATLTGAIYWAAKGDVITFAAAATLPDSELMLIIEKAVSAGSKVVNDTRAVVDISNGVLTTSFAFTETGNWFVTAERINQGLKYIGMPLELSFDTIEFDIHE